MTLMKDRKWHPTNSDRYNDNTTISTFENYIFQLLFIIISIIQLLCIRSYIVNATMLLWETLYCSWDLKEQWEPHQLHQCGKFEAYGQRSKHSASHLGPDTRYRSTDSLKALHTPWLYMGQIWSHFSYYSAASILNPTSSDHSNASASITAAAATNMNRTSSCFHFKFMTLKITCFTLKIAWDLGLVKVTEWADFTDHKEPNTQSYFDTVICPTKGYPENLALHQKMQHFSQSLLMSYQWMSLIKKNECQ